MNKARLGSLLMAAVIAAGCSGDRSREAERQDVVLPRDTEITEAKVPRNATLEGLLRSHPASSQFADSIVTAVSDVFNPRLLRANQPYRVTTSLDGLFREFRYTLDADRFLRVALRDDSPADAPAFDVELVPVPKEIVSDVVEVGITSERPSLWAALEEKGENVQLAMMLSEVFAGDVDFNSDLQDGDSFQVSFDRVLRDGQFSGYDSVRAAVLHNDGRVLTAIRYQGADGKMSWYDAEGRSLRRQFLKSPLGFEPTVTSRFNMNRLHPVLGYVRAHRGVDYRAAYGTPVRAVAPGTVIAAGWAGGAGRRVVIRHASGYESAYFHLSAFAPGLSVGDKVEQGTQIGRVGNSGTVTGTHLHYELKKNGQHINPVTAHRNMPPGVPISADQMPAFQAARDEVLGTMLRTLAAAAAPVAPATTSAATPASSRQ
ncbi:MAG: peptidoglycan DD-metalloendopeptidase family protein [Vicinamibacterales bacterium]